MTVFVLRDEVEEIVGIYSTEEKAKEALAKELPTYNSLEEAKAKDPSFSEEFDFADIDELNAYQTDLRSGYSIDEFEVQ